MLFNREKFNKMVYSPYEKTDQEIIHELRVGVLNEIFGDDILMSTAPEGPAKTVAFVLYLYDMESPLRKAIPDITERKEEALDLAGIDPEHDRKEDLFMLQDEMVAECVYSFLKYQASMDFMLLNTNEQIFWQLNYNMIKEPLNYKGDKELADIMEKKAKNLRYAEEMLGNIHKIEDRIFKGDNAKEVIKKMNRTSPEGRARRPSANT